MNNIFNKPDKRKEGNKNTVPSGNAEGNSETIDEKNIISTIKTPKLNFLGSDKQIDLLIAYATTHHWFENPKLLKNLLKGLPMKTYLNVTGTGDICIIMLMQKMKSAGNLYASHSNAYIAIALSFMRYDGKPIDPHVIQSEIYQLKHSPNKALIIEKIDSIYNEIFGPLPNA